MVHSAAGLLSLPPHKDSTDPNAKSDTTEKQAASDRWIRSEKRKNP